MGHFSGERALEAGERGSWWAGRDRAHRGAAVGRGGEVADRAACPRGRLKPFVRWRRGRGRRPARRAGLSDNPMQATRTAHPAGGAAPAGGHGRAPRRGSRRETARRALMESVDLLVGDLDSVKAEIFARPKQVERHSVDEDATDLELALAAALRLEPDRIRSSEAPGPARPSPRRVREYRLVG
jgi:hypothetical protein